jgi:hypothetical protein
VIAGRLSSGGLLAKGAEPGVRLREDGRPAFSIGLPQVRAKLQVLLRRAGLVMRAPTAGSNATLEHDPKPRVSSRKAGPSLADGAGRQAPPSAPMSEPRLAAMLACGRNEGMRRRLAAFEAVHYWGLGSSARAASFLVFRCICNRSGEGRSRTRHDWLVAAALGSPDRRSRLCQPLSCRSSGLTEWIFSGQFRIGSMLGPVPTARSPFSVAWSQASSIGCGARHANQGNGASIAVLAGPSNSAPLRRRTSSCPAEPEQGCQCPRCLGLNRRAGRARSGGRRDTRRPRRS